MGSPQISVVIPVLNEEAQLPATISACAGDGVQVIVVDGGSSDRSVDVARAHGATVLCSKRGRGRQMNTGAQLADAETLVFLHADTLLPRDWLTVVTTALDEPGVVAAAFSLKIKGASGALDHVQRLANFRSRRLCLPYGDQALSLHKNMFQRIGGYQVWPVMEDFNLVSRLKKLGRVVTLPQYVVTSGRRWETHGVLRTSLVHQCIILGYLAGLSPNTLAAIHRSNGSRIK